LYSRCLSFLAERYPY